MNIIKLVPQWGSEKLLSDFPKMSIATCRGSVAEGRSRWVNELLPSGDPPKCLSWPLEIWVHDLLVGAIQCWCSFIQNSEGPCLQMTLELHHAELGLKMVDCSADVQRTSSNMKKTNDRWIATPSLKRTEVILCLAWISNNGFFFPLKELERGAGSSIR